MNTRHPAVLLPIVFGLMLALSSCGFFSSTSSGPRSCPGATGPGMCVTLSTSGSSNVSGTIFVPRPGTDRAASCATWVKGEGGKPARISLPSAFDTPVGGVKVRFGSHIIGYTGPRTYDGDAVSSGNDGSFSIVLNSRTYSAYHVLLARATAEVRADGSGSVNFVNLLQTPKPTKKKPQGQVGGSYTWTCQD